MMAGTGKTSALRVVAAALALTAPLLLAACASDAPRDTNFDWNLERDPTSDRMHATKPASDDLDSDAYPTRAPHEKWSPGWYNPRPAPHDVDVKPLPAPGSVSFAWPVQGHILSDFGATTSGGRNDGINIAAALGTPIRAAADGVVSYCGNELKSYGNLVLIRHDDGYVTAYAHADSILVSRGDKVVKGQVIGYAGETGDVNQPQVHFEIRHDTAPINPHPLLIASR
jgi:murein DD-endopeptidase MepM/ murein hydrolase activator NlpD